MSAQVAIDQLAERVAALEDIRAERDHWIGEAKRFESLYQSADRRAGSFYSKLAECREMADERVVELERVLDVVHEASKRVWPLIRNEATAEEIRAAIDWISQLASAKTLKAEAEGEGGDA